MRTDTIIRVVGIVMFTAGALLVEMRDEGFMCIDHLPSVARLSIAYGVSLMCVGGLVSSLMGTSIISLLPDRAQDLIADYKK